MKHGENLDAFPLCTDSENQYGSFIALSREIWAHFESALIHKVNVILYNVVTVFRPPKVISAT